MDMPKRCVNIDWLEIHVLEDLTRSPVDANYFQKYGYRVHKRDYGTPMYSEMFSIDDEYGRPWLEVRRNPYSKKSDGGIFADNACHIRLSNKACYSPLALYDLRMFLLAHNYEYRNITRVDICNDFNNFENGDAPAVFLEKYMAGRYHKIGLSRVHLYGRDIIPGSLIVYDDSGRKCKHPKIYQNGLEVAAHGYDNAYNLTFNSVKWGSPTSAINTKLYNKSMEMSQVKQKFHIIDSWKAAGLDTKHDVWRLEFSICSDARDWVADASGETFHLGLSEIDAPDKINRLVNLLTAKYFRFTIAAKNRNGMPQRKDRCKTYMPFDLGRTDVFRPVRLTLEKEPDRTTKMFVKRLEDIVRDKQNATPDERKAAQKLLGYFNRNMRFHSEYADLLGALFGNVGAVVPT